MKKTQYILAGTALSALMLSGCATNSPLQAPMMPQIFGHTKTVSVVDSSQRIKLDTKVTLSDIIAFAENLTNKMLASPVIANAKRPPRIVVGTLRQNTHDENLDIVTRAADGQKLVDYTMKIKLFTLDGELVGQWSDDLSLFKSR